MYYECNDCGQLTTFVEEERSELNSPCPVCEEVTHWTLAFADEGVSY
jgi:predicted nucleic acid-binding Zn ribbon protein